MADVIDMSDYRNGSDRYEVWCCSECNGHVFMLPKRDPRPVCIRCELPIIDLEIRPTPDTQT